MSHSTTQSTIISKLGDGQLPCSLLLSFPRESFNPFRFIRTAIYIPFCHTKSYHHYQCYNSF